MAFNARVSALYHLSVHRENAEIALVLNNFFHQLLGDVFGTSGKAINQRRIAKNVDHPRNPMAGIRDQQTGFVAKQMGVGADCLQAKSDVVADLLFRQSLEVKIRGNTLRQLQEFRSAQHFLELRLPDKDRLQELNLVDIDVLQHPEPL